MFRLRYLPRMLMAILMAALTACNRTGPPPTSTATPEPSPKLALTQVMDMFTHGQPDDPIICADADAAEFRAVPGAQPGAEWAVITNYDFTPDWPVGQHAYTFWFEPCAYSGELPDHLTISFAVTSKASVRDTPVYFGPQGVSASISPDGPFLESIHPTQAVTARLSDIQLTEADAQATARECHTWISIDGGDTRYLLMPHKPCNYAAR